MVDGEAVLLGVDGVSDFEGLHSRKFDHEAQFYAFDILVSGGDDLRSQPLFLRKGALARLAQAKGGRHHPERLRARRDRTGAVQGRLPDGLEG